MSVHQMQRKGHSEYPSNTVIIGMFESYYVPASAGGYPPPPRCTNHSLASYLPDMSLLEVKKSEVCSNELVNILSEIESNLGWFVFQKFATIMF